MADDELTQAEMEALLTAAQPPTPSTPLQKPPAVQSPRAESTRSPAMGTTRPAMPPDRQSGPRDPTDPAGRAPRLDHRQLQALVGIHETFAAGLAKSLGELLRWKVDVQLASLGETSYGEFGSSLENPTCISVLSAAPLGGKLLLEISPTIAFPMIDRLLGGGREPMVVACRPLTQIESRLITRVTAIALAELSAAWRPLVEMRLAVERVDSNVKSMDVATPADLVALARFEIAMHGVRGGMKLCIPGPALAAIRGALAQAGCRHGEATGATSIATPQAASGESSVTLTAELAETTLTAAELAGLSVGDIIATDSVSDGPVVLRAKGGARTFHGWPGAHEGRRAVRIESIVADDE